MLIYLSGGLGNQFFQLSLACTFKKTKTVYLSTYLLNSFGRKPDISIFAEELGIKLVDYKCLCSSILKVNRFREYNDHVDFCCYLGLPDNSPWLYHNNQKKEFAESILKVAQKVNTNEKSTRNQLAIHFRLGDYLWPRALFRYGVLSKIYYQNALLELGNPSIADVFSEDKKALRSIYGKKVLNCSLEMRTSQSTLTDFCSILLYEKVIFSNSTFCFWQYWIRDFMNNAYGTKLVSYFPRPIYRSTNIIDGTLDNVGNFESNFFNPLKLLISFPGSFKRRLRWKPYW